MHFKDMEYINLENTLHAIEHGLISPTRSQIAKHLSISNTTASQVASRLIKLRLIKESGTSLTDKRGRPGIKLEIDPSYWVAVATAFTSRRFLFVVIDPTGRVIESNSIRVKDLSLESCLDTLFFGLKQFITKYKKRVLPTIGISVPGLVNPETGVLIDVDDFDWKNVNFGTMVYEKLGLPALVMNRNWTSGLAEYRFVNKEQNLKNFLYIGVGTDIGSAIIIDGELLKGENFAAGKLGHVVVDMDGPPCPCGKRGCLQVMAAQQALITFIRHELEHIPEQDYSDPFVTAYRENGGKIDLDIIDGMLQEHSSIAMRGIEHVAKILATQMGNMIDIFDPEKVLLGGHLVMKFPQIKEVVVDTLAASGAYSERQSLPIDVASLGDMGSAIGAAMCVLDKKLALLLNGA